MTEPTDAPTPDDELAQHLRAGFDALADEIGAPPPFPRAGQVPAGRPGRARAYALAAAAAVLLVAAGTVVWSARDGSSGERVAAVPDTGPVVDRPIEGTRWWLSAAEADGKPVELVPERGPIGLQVTKRASCEGYVGGGCEEGQQVLWASDTCNGVERVVDVGPATIGLQTSDGPTTGMECSGPLVELLDRVYAAGILGYRIDGDQLRVTRGGAELTYEASDGPFGPTTGTIIDEGRIGPGSYRVVYLDGGLSFQKGDTEHDLVQGGSGLGDDPGRINLSLESVQGRPYVLATVPKAAARVVYEAAGTEPRELEIHEVDSEVSSVVASFVDTAPEAWQLVAYDADGDELHRYGMWDRKEFGAGRSIDEVVAEAGFDDCCTPSGARTAFTSAGTALTFGSGPLPPTMPRDPAAGLEGAGRVTVEPGAGTVVEGRIGDEVAVRFDCAETRYEVRGPQADAGRVLDAATRLSAAAGCPVASIAETG